MIKLAIHKNVHKLEIYKADKKDTKKELREGKLNLLKVQSLDTKDGEWWVTKLAEGEKQNKRDLRLVWIGLYELIY